MIQTSVIVDLIPMSRSQTQNIVKKLTYWVKNIPGFVKDLNITTSANPWYRIL